MRNKKAEAVGESVIMIYGLVLVTFIALVILTVSAIFYDYYVNVRDAEAYIVSRQIVNCVTDNGIVNLDDLKGREKDILDYCGFKNSERYFVQMKIGNAKFSDGDGGLEWVLDLFDQLETAPGQSISEKEQVVEKIKKYEVGTGVSGGLVRIIENGKMTSGRLSVKIIAQHEF